MKLEIRNLQSSATYEIGPDGAVLGREGSKADIVLRDQAVSKKHAKIYEKNGRWYLEDLASSNGTFVDNRRITEPVILNPGAVFALSENQFEVVQVINGRAEALDRDTESQQDAHGQNIDDLPPLGMTPPEDSSGDNKRSPRPMAKNQSARSGSPPQAGADPADDAPPQGAESKGVGYFFIAVPKAIAYYLAAIPLMLVNPIGSIRKGIEEQKFPAMGWMELVAYALPVNFFIALLGVIVGVIVAAVNGVFAIGLLLGGPIYAAISAVIGSLIAGLIWHPVSKWIVNSFLKGSSDEKSRSNWFIATMTASSLNAIPSAVTGLMAILMKIPYVGGFFGIIPPLVSLVATGVMLFTLYSWLKHFGVVNWAQKVVMVLGILAVLGTGVGVVQAVLNSIRMLGSGGGGSAMAASAGMNAGDVEKAAAEAMKNAGMTPEQIDAMKKGGLTAEQQAEMQKKIAEMQKASAKALENAGDAGEAAKKLTEAAMKQAAEAQENAKKAMADAEKAGKEASAKAEKAEKAAKGAAKKSDEDESEEEQPAKAGKAEKAERAEKAVEKRVAPPSKPMLAASAATADDGQLTPFMAFIRKRELVEKTISEDPALLKREDVLNSYKKYLKKTNEIRQKWSKKKSKDFVETRINDHMKDLEVFEGTSRMVDELHGKLFQ